MIYLLGDTLPLQTFPDHIRKLAEKKNKIRPTGSEIENLQPIISESFFRFMRQYLRCKVLHVFQEYNEIQDWGLFAYFKNI